MEREILEVHEDDVNDTQLFDVSLSLFSIKLLPMDSDIIPMCKIDA